MAKLADLIDVGLMVDRPAAGITGRLYQATDDTPVAVYRDNGVSWDVWATVGGAGGGTAATDAAALIYAYLNFR